MTDDLRNFIEQASSGSHLRVEEDLGDGFVRLRTAEAERRQARHDIRSSEDIVIEMLRNSRDAHAHTIFVASSRDESTRKLTIIDDGDGIPDAMFERIFDARVTSKLDSMHMDLWGVHGRGMALYAVKVNAKTARVMASKVNGGTSIHVEADTESLGERKDQSSMPLFLVGDNGKVTVRGPKNILRTVCEFAYIEQDICTVFLGSPADVAATLWHKGRDEVGQSTRAFCNDPGELPVCARLALAISPEEFASISSSIGLELSSRTARRILDGTIAPLKPLDEAISLMLQGGGDSQSIEGDAEAADDEAGHADEQDFLSSVLFRDTRGLDVASKDKRIFQRAVAKAYAQLAEAYYLDPSIQPDIRYRRDRIDIHIPVIKQD